MNEYDELKQQCEKIVEKFRKEVDELASEIEGLKEAIQFIEFMSEKGSAASMRSIVEIYGKVTEGNEDGRQ